MRVAVIGSRNRSSVKDFLRGNTELVLEELAVDSPELKAIREKVQGKDRDLLNKLVEKLESKYRRNLTIVSVGCDDGIGYIIRSICEERHIWFAEISVHFKGERRPRADYSKYYLSRNATVMELMDMSILLTSWGQSIAQDLLDRIKIAKKPLPYVVIDEDNRVIETNTDEFDLVVGAS